MSNLHDELFLEGMPLLDPVAPVSAHLSLEPTETVGDLRLPAPLGEMIARDTAPLPARYNRESYSGEHHYNYWLAGLRHAIIIRDLAERAGVRLDPDSRVFELGPSTGRVLRHFAFQFGLRRVYGADISRTNVEWVTRHLPESIEIFQNTVLPVLPYTSESFDLAYAVSVFTHIDALEHSWLLELRRILKPGGVAVISIHSDDTWRNLAATNNLLKNLIAHGDKFKEGPFDASYFGGPMPKERLTFTLPPPVRTGANCQTFHSSAYVRRVWGRFFEVVEIAHQSLAYHSAVVLRKR